MGDDVTLLQQRLEITLRRRLGRSTTVEDLQRASGGASRETWTFTAQTPGHREDLVLQRDAHPDAAGFAVPRSTEYRLLERAHAAGVPVPRPRFPLETGDGLGEGFVVARVKGETIARRILRDPALTGARGRLAAACGRALAGIHALRALGDPGLDDFAASGHPARTHLERFRAILDTAGEPFPTFELGLRWLAERLPPVSGHGLVHGDFRLGNLVVGFAGLEAVLDWELAHLGDPLEDLGWLCVRAWRFGHDELPVGGFGERETLFAAYEQAGGRRVDPDAVRFWEALGTLRWGVICVLQAGTYLSGRSRSVELAAIGRRICEVEHDLLLLLEEEA